jgi:hypothetical protein
MSYHLKNLKFLENLKIPKNLKNLKNLIYHLYPQTHPNLMNLKYL